MNAAAANKPRDAAEEAESAHDSPPTNHTGRGGRSVAKVQRNRLVAAQLDHQHEQRNRVDGDVKRKQHGRSLHPKVRLKADTTIRPG